MLIEKQFIEVEDKIDIEIEHKREKEKILLSPLKFARGG